VSQSRDAGTKPTLIKRLYKSVVILLTIVLAMYPSLVGAYVPEMPEPTYSPEVEWLDSATTTQPSVAEVIATTSPTQSVVEEILKVFPDAPIMVEVARCESGLDPLADRANLNVDVGLFQINQVHNERLAQLGLDRRDIHDNLQYARMLYDESGLGPWYMSEHCWG
jgi:Transglycosylase SLT domain